MRRFLCIGGPWDWRLLSLRNGPSGTLPFSVTERDIVWRGRYVYGMGDRQKLRSGAMFLVLYWEGNAF